MDKPFNKLSHWLLFELIVTVLMLFLYLKGADGYAVALGDLFYMIVLLFVGRIFFLGRAWFYIW